MQRPKRTQKNVYIKKGNEVLFMKKIKRLLVLLLTLAIVATGCGSKEGTSDSNNAEQGVQSIEEINIARKYREELINLPQGMPDVASVIKNGEQSYRVLGIDAREDSDGMKVFETSDDGMTWEDISPEWFAEWKQGKYIFSWAQAPDKSIVLGYVDSDTWDYVLITPDGEKEDLALTKQDGTVPDGDSFIKLFTFSEDNRLFAMDISSVVYEVDLQTGKMTKILDGESAVYMNISNQMLIVISTSSIYLYDLESGSLLERDPVLEEFIFNNADVWAMTDRNDSKVMITKADDNALYVFGNGGIYRHIIGGTAMELILDGSGNSLSEPDISFLSAFSESDSVFVLLTADGRLLRYTYDENMEIKEPEEGDTVRIYSLREDKLIQWAVSLYQKNHPDKKVIYEVGMTPENGVTREDAIKNLNTKLLSEDGPDIIVLDDLQQDSLLEKGVLRDVSGLIAEAEAKSPLLSNIKNVYVKDGAIYYMPCTFQIPMAAGDEADLLEFEDLASLADKVEKLRKEKPDGLLIGLRVPEQILGIFTPICMGSWETEEGELDEDALLTFFECINRIYKAEIAGWTEEQLATREETSAYVQECKDTEMEKYVYMLTGHALRLMTGDYDIIVGNIGNVQFDLAELTSAIRERGSGTFGLLNGQQKNVFLPATVVGMNAGKEPTQTAEDFYKYLFSEELQTEVSAETLSFSVNETVFNKMLVKDENAEELSIGSSDENGNRISLEIKFPNADEIAKLQEIAMALDTPAENHAVLEDAVYEAGIKLLNGEIDESKAVKEVAEKMSLYLSE